MSSMDELGFNTISWGWLQPQQPQEGAVAPQPEPEPEPGPTLEELEATLGAKDADGLWRPHRTETMPTLEEPEATL